VDVELSDAVQRLRFEHPEVGAVVVTGGTEDAFCTEIGNRIPRGSSPAVRADVATFANEVRCAIEDAGANSGQRWLAALNGSASGPGYELALATDEIVLVDDGRSTVSLPEVTVLGELPATGGLIRLVDKRRVRPDLVDVFCTRPLGAGGEQARTWGLVDGVVPRPRFAEVVRDRALAAAGSPRAAVSEAVELSPLRREEFDGGFAYPDLRVELDEEAGTAFLTLVGPSKLECFAPEPGPRRLRSRWWPLAVCRELDDALLLLRANWPALGALVLRTEGDPLAVAAADVALTTGYEKDWFVREVVLYWKRTLKRLGRTSHSVIALVEPGSCFVGTLLELALAADQSYMLEGIEPDRPDLPPAEIFLTSMNFGPLPGASGLTRLQTRFLDRDPHLAAIVGRVGDPIAAAEAAEMGLVTGALPAADWGSRTRQVIDGRAGLAPDALTALTANLRGAGPETLESKIFGRVTAWQNWILRGKGPGANAEAPFGPVHLRVDATLRSTPLSGPAA
jgi:benzoyl-CoA-dihydrodiol lyase